jgi:hypothetical protein
MMHACREWASAHLPDVLAAREAYLDAQPRDGAGDAR